MPSVEMRTAASLSGNAPTPYRGRRASLYIGSSPPIPGGLLGITTAAGIIIGVINGLAMGLLVPAAERGRALDRIPWWRFALWGAAATGAAAWLVFTTAVIALGCAALGAVASVGALALARRPATDATDPS